MTTSMKFIRVVAFLALALGVFITARAWHWFGW